MLMVLRVLERGHNVGIISSPLYDTPVSARSARQFQLSVRYKFWSVSTDVQSGLHFLFHSSSVHLAMRSLEVFADVAKNLPVCYISVVRHTHTSRQGEVTR